MTSSMVSSMVLFLLLLLVFPHIDKALGAQEETQKQSESFRLLDDRRSLVSIYVQKRLIILIKGGGLVVYLENFMGNVQKKFPPVREISIYLLLRPNFCRVKSPPRPHRSFKGTFEPDH
ncbi:unnamed protein product [Thlaspi arvense]|uniref:Uncharacterized protein n=1 Tax=Thlaspi arvense TaxID=13288 RepID=A0AAU9SL97_THLAR|nr:unnamed protein product [Thlaspi arvense]